MIGIFTIPRFISQQKALAISAVLGIIFSFSAFFSTGYVAISFIALLGLANALMWPAIFPLAIDGLGRFTKIGSALLIMGIIGGALIPPLLIMGIAGGAVMPLLYTSLKDKGVLSNHMSFLVCMAPAYLFILFYAVKGYRAGKPVQIRKSEV